HHSQKDHHLQTLYPTLSMSSSSSGASSGASNEKAQEPRPAGSSSTRSLKDVAHDPPRPARTKSYQGGAGRGKGKNP
ncbi:unnamed protein product, partial [Amoebophrya sp. A120]